MITNHRLKIGLDYHGLIDINKSFFSDFCIEAKHRGHNIYIITGGPKVLVEDELNKSNIKHDFVYAISDYYQALKIINQSKNGRLYISDDLWDNAKAEFCYKNRVDIHIDDNMKYLELFSTPYCCYDKLTNKGIISTGDEVDFSKGAKFVLAKIEQILI